MDHRRKKQVQSAVVLGAAFVIALASQQTSAAIQTETITYDHGGVRLAGHLAYDDAVSGKRAAVLVVHEWWGLNEYARSRAEQLAGLGYIAFAVDMYGKGKSTDHPDQAKQWSRQLANAQLMRDRAAAGLRVLAANGRVDPSRVAVIGYCFGATTALQLAYSGADIKAAVSFHGSLPIPTINDARRIKAKILVCHGAEDGFVPKERITAFKAALRGSSIDWRFVKYDRALHSFTVPGSENRGIQGLAYNPDADRRSWDDMLRLFDEVLAD